VDYPIPHKKGGDFMAILAECPRCRRKQGRDNDSCLSCGYDLERAKRSQNVRYWISYYLPGSKKQRRELVGNSIKEARQAEGKRMGQKKENRFSWDMMAGADTTFQELTDWYLNLEKVKKLSSYAGVKIRLNNFNKVYGHRPLKDIRLEDLENYQHIRSSNGIKNATIDVELVLAKTVINKAWKNNMVSGDILKTFQNVEGLATKEERSRDRILTMAEYLSLVDYAPKQERCKMILAMHTGMRPGEIKGLRWSHIDRKGGFIRLPAIYTKEDTKRSMPINHHVEAAMDSMIRHLNSDFVFTYAGGRPTRYSGPSSAFKTTCKRAGISCGKKVENGIIPHDFRRTFKTNCVKAGIDPAWRNALLGHSQSGMDAHYIKPSEEDLQRAMDRYTRWFDGEMEKSSDQSSDQTI
jgi:integrase